MNPEAELAAGRTFQEEPRRFGDDRGDNPAFSSVAVSEFAGCLLSSRILHVNCREHAVAKVMPFDALPAIKPSAPSGWPQAAKIS